MMSINPFQSFDWTARNLYKAFNEWLEEVNLFFERQKFEREGKDYAAKTANVVKKKKSLFIFRKKRSTHLSESDSHEGERRNG